MIYTDKESGCTIMSGADKYHYLMVTESGRELNIYSIFEITDSNAQEIINYYLTERKDDEE